MGKLSEFKDYPIKDFLDWYENNSLTLSPKFQRNSVWNVQAKSYLIDTILRGLTIPPVFLKEYIDIDTKKTVREVIDGQQRLTAIIDFYNNEFNIIPSHNRDFANKYYKDLDDEAQIDFLGFNIPIILIKTTNDSIIYDMFARLNTNNIVLNKQEIRNAKFWGEFKVFANKITTQYRNFFIQYKTFNDKQISRMLDIELINSFIIVTIDGIITETPTKVDQYYEKYDENFENLNEIENKINIIMKIIMQLFELPTYNTTFFHTKVALYTLFTSIHFLIYTNEDLQNDLFQNIYKINFNEQLLDENNNIDIKFLNFLKIKLENFESILIRTKEGELEGEIYKNYKTFLDHHRTRTTSKRERTKRIQFLLEYLTKE